MKYKLLLYGTSNVLIKDFYMQVGYSYECMTTSYIKEDFMCHLKYFKPHVYIHFIGNDPANEAFKLFELKREELFMRTPIIIIGNKEDCEIFSSTVSVNLVIKKPISSKKLEDTISSFLETNVKKRKEEEKDDEKIEENTAYDSFTELLLNSIEPKKNNPTISKNTGPKKHILIIDDDKSVLKMLKQSLNDTYEVTTVTSARMGRNFLEKNTTDLILLDYQMPEESGPEFYRGLTKNMKTKNIPVIFLTGVADKEKIKDALLLKPKGYLLKPIDVKKLCAAIDDVFE